MMMSILYQMKKSPNKTVKNEATMREITTVIKIMETTNEIKTTNKIKEETISLIVTHRDNLRFENSQKNFKRNKMKHAEHSIEQKHYETTKLLSFLPPHSLRRPIFLIRSIKAQTIQQVRHKNELKESTTISNKPIS